MTESANNQGYEIREVSKSTEYRVSRRQRSITKYRLDGATTYLLLRSKKEEKLETAIASEDLARVLEYIWYPIWNKTGQRWYAVATVNGSITYLHRFVMDAPPHTYVDHINGDGLDNRRANLRVVTMAENMGNRTRVSNVNSKTGVRGVSRMRTGSPSKGYREYWGFRCSNKLCPKTKYFDYTEEGYAEACEFATAHYKKLEIALALGGPVAPEEKPAAYRSSTTGARGVTTWTYRYKGNEKKYWQFICRRPECRAQKNFPYTDEGLAAAVAMSREHFRQEE